MTTPTVIEITRVIEPIGRDTFIDGADRPATLSDQRMAADMGRRPAAIGPRRARDRLRIARATRRAAMELGRSAAHARAA